MAAKALLLNEGYSDNLGDQAIRLSAQFALEQLGFTVEFADFTRTTNQPQGMTEDLTKDIKLERWAPKNIIPKGGRWLIKNFLRVIREAKKNYNIAVIGGGQLILPNGKFPLALCAWVIAIRLLSQSRVYVIGIGAEQLKGLDRLMVEYALRRVDGIAVRDSRSSAVVESLINRRVKVLPDWAFLMDKIYPSQDKALTAPARVLINIPHLYVYQRYRDHRATRSEYYKFWLDCYLELLGSEKDVRLFYTAAEDKYEAEAFRQYLQSQNIDAPVVAKCDTLEELLGEIQAAKLVVSGRMHALILAQVYGKARSPYIISKKLETFVIQYDDQDVKQLQEALMESLRSILQL